MLLLGFFLLPLFSCLFFLLFIVDCHFKMFIGICEPVGFYAMFNFAALCHSALIPQYSAFNVNFSAFVLQYFNAKCFKSFKYFKYGIWFSRNRKLIAQKRSVDVSRAKKRVKRIRLTSFQSKFPTKKSTNNNVNWRGLWTKYNWFNSSDIKCTRDFYTHTTTMMMIM